MKDTQLSWQARRENARLWVAERDPPAKAQVFIKQLLCTQLYAMRDLKYFKKTERS